MSYKALAILTIAIGIFLVILSVATVAYSLGAKTPIDSWMIAGAIGAGMGAIMGGGVVYIFSSNSDNNTRSKEE